MESRVDAAYKRIHDWLKKNPGLLEQEGALKLSPGLREEARQVILGMADPSSATDQDKINLLEHVSTGALQWAAGATGDGAAYGDSAREALALSKDAASSSSSKSSQSKENLPLKAHLEADGDAVAWDLQNLDLGPGAEAFLKIAGAAAAKAGRKVSTTLLMICIVEQGRLVRDPLWTGDFMRTQINPYWSAYRAMRDGYLSERRLKLDLSLDEARHMPQARSCTSSIAELLKRAEHLAFRTTSSRRIAGRHLLAAFFALPRPSQGLKALKRLEEIGANVDLIAGNLQGWVDGYGDLDDAWKAILLGESSRVRIAAGFDSDNTGDRDQLGITPDVNALATLIAARTVSPPLSIGLFGDWGSGKTFFMRQLRRAIKVRSQEARKSGQMQRDQAFYKHIVQIEFNAWHYVEGNLWASLVEHILDNLVSPDDDTRLTLLEQMQKHWIDQLGFKKEAMKTADEMTVQAQEKVKAAEGAVKEAERKNDAKALELQELSRKNVARDFQLSGAVAAIQAALGPLGLQPASDAVKDLEASLKEARSAVGRGGTVLAPLLKAEDRASRWRSLTIILVGAPVTAAVLSALASWSGWSRVTAVAAAVTPYVLWAAKWIRAQAEWASTQLDKVEKAQQKFNEELAKQQAETAKEITRTEHELAVARQELAAAQAQATLAAREAEAAQVALAEATPTRLLGQYVADRAASSDYRKHLGVLAVVRDDFEKLSNLIEAENWRLSPDTADDAPRLKRGERKVQTLQEEDNTSSNRINRIVLYIDDLDRCPPAKVVDVLQAVHLLLAFPLFVVVVGVDARWISKSLETRYRELLRADGEGAAAELARSFGIARSEDYLEKIFQIPLWLRPMEPSDVRRMVHGLVRGGSKPPANQAATGTSTNSGGAETASLSSLPTDAARDERPASLVAEPQAPTALPITLHSPKPTDQPSPGSTAAAGEALATGSDDAAVANVESLRISDQEHAAMNAFAPILGRSPRALKRFVNVYRLLKARLTPAAHAAFLQTSGESRLPDFTVALFVLAVDTGLPRISRHVAEAIADPSYKGGRIPRPAPVPDDSLEDWNTLDRWFDDLDPGFTSGLHRSTEWVHLVSRFSFRAAAEAIAPKPDASKKKNRAARQGT
jgi:hypothetical protein